jgi:hypothetical protein
LAEELVQGNHHDVNNPLHWKDVILNLPGSDDYQPQLPWVYRTTHGGHLAGVIKRYVDDIRSVGHSESHCWSIGHHVATYYSYLGLQIALRKMRPPSQHPGPWAGTIAFSCSEGVGVTCPVTKWTKAKTLLAELQATLTSGASLPRKPLEATRGFFIHLMRTFPIITPYLKGMHLTLDGWRSNRDEEMWKFSSDLWDTLKEDLPPLNGPPTDLEPAPRLASDVKCLLHLLDSPTPPTRMIRCTQRLVVIYGFVDASAAGFGGSFSLPDGSILFRHGLWGRDADSETSNFRELCNLVESIEDGVNCGELADSELFILTDNTTAEGCYYKGNSDSKPLFQLVLRLRKLEMSAMLRLHVIHVAGTRMIHQGTDGLSRGLLTDGIFATDAMKLHIPLHLTAPSRQPALVPWVQSWCPETSIEPLTPSEWFHAGHGLADAFSPGADATQHPTQSTKQWYLWTPPPAAARAALEELAVSRIKRPHLNHIFVCPRLFTSQWRRLMFKLSDLVFEIPAGSRPFWPISMHEPLVCSLTLRFLSSPPFTLRQHPSILDLGRTLHGLWAHMSGDERGVLRQLCNTPAALDSVRERVARPLLHTTPR